MPTYGKTGVGASWRHCELRYIVRTVTLTGGESVVGWNAYLRSVGTATNEWYMALWDKTDDSLEYQSDAGTGFTDTSGGWKTAGYSGGNPAADTYWLGLVGEGVPGGGNTIEAAYDTITADTTNYRYLYYAGTLPTLGDPLDIGDEDSGSGTNDVSIYLETAAAGGDPEGSLIHGKLINGGLLINGVLT